MSNQLIDFWASYAPEAYPFAHPEDLQLLRKYGRITDNQYLDFEAYISGTRFGSVNDEGLHLSLLPVPYVGNLQNAEIIILLLNPGFEHSDYWAEAKILAFRKRLEMNLKQEFVGCAYPFLYLDPEFCWHSGFRWWERKLRAVIQVIAAERFGGNYRDPIHDLSNRMACVELFPYHSASFADHRLITRLPSVQEARAFVRESLVKDAADGTRLLIVTRQRQTWGIEEQKNVVVYRGGETLGASLSPQSRGGRAILMHYGLLNVA